MEDGVLVYASRLRAANKIANPKEIWKNLKKVLDKF